MTGAQIVRYMTAIQNELTAVRSTRLTPDLLFQAATGAVSKDASRTEARVGLLPGTMNPIHYGHLSVSLASILGEDLDSVVLAPGCTVPDKPDAAEWHLRHDMATIAVGESGCDAWLGVTPIRKQISDMFSGSGDTLALAGETTFARRATMDIAAFIWLFSANPRVHWTYLVGSDKVARYGSNDEYALVVQTLGNERVRARVVYHARPSDGVSVEAHIEPYRWMLDRWQTGFFKPSSSVSPCALTSVAIRRAIAQGRNHVDDLPLTDCLPRDVLGYIRANELLMTAYIREVERGL